MRGMIKRSPRATLFIEFTKEAYANPRAFFDKLLADFGHVYVILPDGHIAKPKSQRYEAVIEGNTPWSMPIFSKRADLATDGEA